MSLLAVAYPPFSRAGSPQPSTFSQMSTPDTDNPWIENQQQTRGSLVNKKPKQRSRILPRIRKRRNQQMTLAIQRRLVPRKMRLVPPKKDYVKKNESIGPKKTHKKTTAHQILMTLTLSPI